MKRIYIYILVGVLLIGALAWGVMGRLSQQEIEESEEEVETYIHSGWIPYWDTEDAIAEMFNQEVFPKEVVSFSALFDHEEDQILILEEVDEMINHLKEVMPEDSKLFLSFVNDIRQEDGGYVQKEQDFLRRIFATEERMDKHIEELLHIAKYYGVDGIEIDYENLKKDKELWEKFPVFISRLYEVCQAENLELRVVLAYNSTEYAKLPEGPHYVIMCYNLYGLHSDAGPKADYDFLQSAFEKNEVLKPNVSMAFANGGFDWDEEGTIKSLTGGKAKEIQKIFQVEAKRDTNSQAMYFDYLDERKNKHTVWYADQVTIAYWVQLAQQAGYTQHALWRFGDY